MALTIQTETVLGKQVQFIVVGDSAVVRSHLSASDFAVFVAMDAVAVAQSTTLVAIFNTYVLPNGRLAKDVYGSLLTSKADHIERLIRSAATGNVHALVASHVTAIADLDARVEDLEP